MARSPYREFIFDGDALNSLKRLGLSEQLIAEIVRNPLRTEKDDEGRVVSVQRDHATGAHLFITHEPRAEGKPTPGSVRTLDTVIQQVRLEGAPRLR